jgi:predicted ATPase/DNA-binding CsgD family transcriptional regulator
MVAAMGGRPLVTSPTPEAVAGNHGGGLDPVHGMLISVATRRTSAVLVGRDAEFAALREALKRARDDEPTAVLVGGEAGVGKTRLLDEFTRYARAGGARVLTGHCLELGEEGLPFAPFAAVLRQVLRADGPSAFDGHAPDFARLLPELGPTGPMADHNRGYLFDLVAGLFATLAASRPLVLVIEDLHWADRSTRDLIGFLVRAARTAQVLLICTFRTDELHRGHPLRPFLAELDRARGVERLELGRLDRDGTGEILAALLGAEPSPRAVDKIFRRAQGNPLFIEELAAAGDPVASADIPDSLRDLLLARVDRLPEPAQPVLRVAAAGGTRITHALLAKVAGLPGTELEQALRAVVAAQLVVADPEGGYEFRHALVREAVHEDLLPGERARIHAGYAAAIEADPQLVAAGRAPAELAHHWYAAHDNPKALVAARTAAEAAHGRYAYAEQARLLERVLELWEQVPDAQELLGIGHLTLLEDTLDAAYSAGDYHRALSLTRVALGEVDEQADPLRAARLLERRGKLLAHVGKADGLAELRRAYELAGQVTDDPRRATVLADIAYHIGRLDRVEGTKLAQEARAVAAEVGDAEAEVSAVLTLGRVCSRDLTAADGLPELRRVAERARERNDLLSLVKAQVNISDALFELGEYAESARVAEAGAALALKIGVSRSNGAYLRSNHAEALLALGRWDDADAVCAEAARFDPPGELGLHWLELRAGLRLARGHSGAADLVNRALGYLARPYTDPQLRLPLLALRIEAALAAGDEEGAVSAAVPGLADPMLDDNPRYAWPILVAAVRMADPAVRSAVADVAARLEARYPPEVAGAAEVAACLAEGDAALPAWEAAVAARRTDGPPYPLARALVGLATAAAAAGDRAAAAVALEEAGAIAADLDARPLREEVATLARRVGVRGAVGAGPDVLTAREREVLRLVAQGHSNSRIGKELYLSPKTVSVHVSRIIAKLEVANRIEAAAVAHRLGLI